MFRWGADLFLGVGFLGSRFPLTPALSPEERENYPQSVGAAEVGRNLEGRPVLFPFPGEREQPGPALEDSRTAGFVNRLARILPLPEAEGRGEGERDARNAADAQERTWARSGVCQT